MGEHAKALADFTEALRLDRKNVDAYLHRASSHARKGRYLRAIRDYAWSLLARVHRALGRRANPQGSSD
jgi:hypothetical protein